MKKFESLDLSKTSQMNVEAIIKKCALDLHEEMKIRGANSMHVSISIAPHVGPTFGVKYSMMKTESFERTYDFEAKP